MDLAGQIVPSREMLESGKLAHWASVKDQLVQVSRAHVDGTVARRLLKWSFLPELQVVDSRSFARSRPLKLHDDALYQRYPDGRGFLFNFSSRWAYLCTPSESGWLEQALGGDARPPSEPVDEARRDDFLRKLLVGRFLDVALAPPPAALPLDRSYSARIETRAGTLEFALLPEEAPRAVANFVHLARAGWYDGLAIERSHPGAYLVAGAVLSTGAPAYVLPAERTARRTRRGSLWMSIARDATRFTVCRAPWPPLDDRGAVIGELAGDDGALDRLTRGDAIVRVVIVERPLDPPS